MTKGRLSPVGTSSLPLRLDRENPEKMIAAAVWLAEQGFADIGWN